MCVAIFHMALKGAPSFAQFWRVRLRKFHSLIDWRRNNPKAILHSLALGIRPLTKPYITLIAAQPGLQHFWWVFNIQHTSLSGGQIWAPLQFFAVTTTPSALAKPKLLPHLAPFSKSRKGYLLLRYRFFLLQGATKVLPKRTFSIHRYFLFILRKITACPHITWENRQVTVRYANKMAPPKTFIRSPFVFSDG